VRGGIDCFRLRLLPQDNLLDGNARPGRLSRYLIVAFTVITDVPEVVGP
jgi:hypothetical protein